MQLLQNPVNTMAWSMAQMHLLAPLVTLVRDCAVFCDPPLKSKPFMFVGGGFTLMISVLVLTGPAPHANLFHLFIFRRSFRWQFDVLGFAGIVPYVVALHIVRHVLKDYDRRRINV